MEKISPPLRIALAAVVLLAVVWFVALRPKAPAEEEPLPVAPGVAGLTSDVQKARDAKEAADAAAAAAQKAAAGAEAEAVAAENGADKAAAATNGTGKAAAATNGTGKAAAATNGTDKAAAATNGTDKAAAATNGTDKAAAVQTPAGTAVAVERPAAQKPAKPATPADPAAPLVAALRQGRVVILVFRNASSDSEAVAAAVRRVPKGSRATPRGTKPAVVRVVPITQVGRYATFTEKTQISQAPTTLIIGPKRNAKVIVGYTTAPEVAEAVRDLRAARR